jgi:hypothetical protein
MTVLLPFCVLFKSWLTNEIWTHKTYHTVTARKEKLMVRIVFSYLIPFNLSVPIQVILTWCSVRIQPPSLGEQVVCVLNEFLYLWIVCSSQSDINVFTPYSSVLTIQYFWNWRLVMSWLHLNWQLARCRVIST